MRSATIPYPPQFNYRAICALLNLPLEYTTDLGATVEGGEGSTFAYLEVTLKRTLTPEEFEAIMEAAKS